MTKSSKKKLEYMARYEATPEQKRRRAMRNAARRQAMREGLVHKGDGKEVDHIHRLDHGGTNSDSNLRVIPAEKNRGWRKGKKGYDE